jgi:hypothetical protein
VKNGVNAENAFYGARSKPLGFAKRETKWDAGGLHTNGTSVAPDLAENFSTMSRPFMWRGMVQDPELNNRNCRDHDPNREMNLHSHCVAVKTEDPGARR